MSSWGIATGLVVVGIGATRQGYTDEHVRVFYVIGAWLVGLAVLLAFMYAVVWPTLNWLTGPLRNRIWTWATRRKGLVVLDAAYGGNNVTSALNRRINDRGLSLLVDPSALAMNDPDPNVRKCLDVSYAVDGERRHKAAWDGEVFILP